mmetsp:Transcript_2239/g.4099  ORF Transcript_2239/g.4099 Transcript_2239/m.4099 type:complete len:360 (-) Transcript_2239:46-1125(-)
MSGAAAPPASPTPNTARRASSSNPFDTRQFLVAAIFLWVVHTWTVSITTHHLSSSSSPSDAFLSPASASTSKSSSDDYQLAKSQSFGFFNDIPTQHWRTLQTYHAKLFPNYYQNLLKYSHGPKDKGNIPKLRNANMWYGQNFQVEFICPLARRLPSDSMADGPKWVCNPHRLAQQKDCLIYSVGSNGKAEFEKAVIEEIGDHCEVHTFDPVSYNKRNGDFATALHPYSKFHNWGLGTENEAKSNPRFKTLKQTMEELGHTGKTIDVFKIDCEWCEWFTWQEWLTVDMRQILVETHNAPMPNARDFFFNLHDNGFVIFNKEANYENGAGGVEFAFVKVSTDFFLNDTMYNRQSSLPGSGI